MSRAEKRRAWAFGLNAETWATRLLWLKGYRVLARRFKSPVGEIDIIARRGHHLCFIEVKGRNSEATDAPLPVSERQMQRISRAALAFLQARPDLATLDIRFDAILVRPRQWPRHLVDIWRPG